MTEAEKLFNDTFARCIEQMRIMYSFRLASREGMEGARKRIAEEKVDYIGRISKDPEYDTILIDKAAFFKEHPADKLVEEMTATTIAEAQSAIDTASIIFAHGILDAAAFDYCQVTALAIATAASNYRPYWSQLSKIARLEVRPMLRCVREFSVTRGMVGQALLPAILRRAGNLEVCKVEAYWLPAAGLPAFNIVLAAEKMRAAL